MGNNELLQAIRIMIQEEIKPINQRLDRMEEGLLRLKEEVASIKEDVAELKTTVNNIEGQQIEHSRIIHALRHNSEEVNAQLHSIGHNLNVLTGKAATKEDVAELHAKFDILNNRLFQQEVAIHQLKAVK